MTSQNPRAKRCRLASPRCLTFCSIKMQDARGEDLILCAIMVPSWRPHAVRPILRLENISSLRLLWTLTGWTLASATALLKPLKAQLRHILRCH
ncbi:hypothetical protein FJTKL_04029 [Diaporthe vaccinii]|uniref:Uncharacterized protein n=1 Tax=Diaporthe vaccinii TaxID=105482 RepID=A0ABR4DUM9_9PEZI